MVSDTQLFELLEKTAGELVASRFQQPHDTAHEVALASELRMMQELQPNLLEDELRRLVDFGHTFSPVLESGSGYEIRHGEAVALDMVLSTIIAARRGICEPAVLARLVHVCATVGLPISQSVCSAADLHCRLNDTRLHRGGALNLVLPTKIGSGTFVQDLSLYELADAVSTAERLQAENVRVKGAAAGFS